VRAALDPDARRRAGGVLLAAAAYGMWGVLPIYWKALEHVGATEVVAHRLVWMFAMAVVLVALWRRTAEVRRIVHSGRLLALLALTAVLIGGNFLSYIYGVATERVLECALGYFIAPLVQVVLGAVVLRERLRRWQFVAALLAAVGVGSLLARHGVPWIALAVAGTASAYTLLRKTAPVAPLPGLTVEGALLALPCLAYLNVLAAGGRAAFVAGGWGTSLLLVGAGAVTLIPMLCFIVGARRVRLSTVGFLQYLTPTGNFLLAWLAFREPLPLDRLVAFLFIWAGLAVFTWDSWRHRPRTGGQTAGVPEAD